MNKRKAVKKHPDVIAWEQWLSSEEGQGCLKPGAAGQYLENRLWRAFFAGIGHAKQEQRREKGSS